MVEYLRVKIRRLGPIRDSEVELADLTVFYGPPDSGKSYLLKRIYAELMLLDEALKGLFSLLIPMIIFEKVEKEINYAKAIGKESVEVSADLVQVLEEVKGRWLESFAEVGEVSFQPSPLSLLRDTKIKVKREGVELHGTELTIRRRVDEESRSYKLIQEVVDEALEPYREYLRRKVGIEGVTYVTYGRAAIQALVLNFLYFVGSIPEIPEKREVKLSLPRLSRLEIVEKLNKVLMKGVEALSPEIILIMRLLLSRGSVKRFFGTTFNLVEGLYVKGDVRVPLRRASAFANEISALLKVIEDNKGGLILIEEPESQLHPSAQVLMSIFLYENAQRNKIVISTHSPFVISTIAMLKLSGGCRVNELLKELGFEGDVRVRDIGVNFYYFNYNGNVTKIEKEEVERMMRMGLRSIDEVSDALLRWFSTSVRF